MKKILKGNDLFVREEIFMDLETGELISPVETEKYRIVQVAESFYRGAFSISRHVQRCDLELTLPVSGSLLCETDDTLCRVERGEVHIALRGEHHTLSGRRGCRFCTLAIDLKAGAPTGLLARLCTSA